MRILDIDEGQYPPGSQYFEEPGSLRKKRADFRRRNQRSSGGLRGTQYEDIKHTDLAVEAATENEELKYGIFKKLDETLAPEAILASNTSSISITRLQPRQIALLR